MVNRYLAQINKFMQDRYGVDQLTIALLVMNLILTMLGQFFIDSWLLYISTVPLVFIYFRIFSKNKMRRHQENIMFLKFWYPIETHLKSLFKFRQKSVPKRSNTYRYYTCKQCGQKLRVPKGKGKLTIKCPKCAFEFTKRT